MKIQQITNQHRRDFSAILECEHCGGTQSISTGYDDAHYHDRVIPAMTCVTCGKTRAGDIPPVRNDRGAVHVSPGEDCGTPPPTVKVIVENAVKDHTTVDLLCASITQKLITPAKALNASQAEILTALVKTTAMYAKFVNKPALSAQLHEIVDVYEAAIAAGKQGKLGEPAVEVVP